MIKHAAIYARVSTDQQTTANQLTELRAAASHDSGTCEGGTYPGPSARQILGRPPVDASVERAIRKARDKGKGIKKIARELGVGVGTVQRVVAKAA